MKYENKFGKVKITLEQLLTLFDDNIIDINIVDNKYKSIYCGSKETIPADCLGKYIDNIKVRYDTNFSPYKFKSKVTLEVMLENYIRRVNV